MEKIASPTEARQSQAVLEETHRLMAESRDRVQQMLLADGFTPRTLHPRQARRAT